MIGTIDFGLVAVNFINSQTSDICTIIPKFRYPAPRIPSLADSHLAPSFPHRSTLVTMHFPAFSSFAEVATVEATCFSSQ